MRPRRKRHPNYKAYLSRQLRILQEKYPFLSSQQMKAKICSSWERFTPQQKDDWRITIGRRNSGRVNDLPVISHNSEESSTSESQPDDNSHKSVLQYHKIPPSKETRKRVSFLEPISIMEEDRSFEDTPSQDTTTTATLWPNLSNNLSNDFNAIMAHELYIEKRDGEDGQEIEEKQDNSWSMFGDLSAIFSTPISENECVQETDEDQEDSEEMAMTSKDLLDSFFSNSANLMAAFKIQTSQDGPMCDLFDSFKPKLHSMDKRFLSCLDQSKEKPRVARLFEDDDQFFA